MKFKTKAERLQAVIDAYTTHVKQGPFTIEEIATWAEAKSLYPTPVRGDPPEICEAWETLLQEAIDAVRSPAIV